MVNQFLSKSLSIVLIFFAMCGQNLASNNDTLPTYFSISYIPSLKWNVNFMDHETIGTPLTLNFDISEMAVYEGNFALRKLKMGISAQLENNIIGKIYRWGGYLGYKNMVLRLQTSKMTGNYVWEGPLPDGYFASNTFTNNYFNVDLIKIVKKKRYINGEWVVNPTESQMGFYWGIGYTSMGYPVQLNTLITEGGRENQKFGIPAYDTLYNIQSYNIGFGFDLLRQLCLTGGRYSMIPGKEAKHFGVYASTQDKVGFGPSQISNYGVNMAEALNPGKKVVTDKFFNCMVHYSLSLGFRYYIRKGYAAYIFAVGYDFEGAAMIPFGGAADTAQDLGFDFIHAFYNHGVSFKLYLALNRNWK